jgi:arylformamidase
MGTFIELAHVLEDRMPVYPGLPQPRIDALLTHEASRDRYQGKAEFYLGHLDMPCNVGTYMDVPFHRFPDRPDLSAVGLHAVAGLPGVVVDAPPDPGPIAPLEDDGSFRGAAVLVRTGWSERWGTDRYWEPEPFLGEAAVDALVRAAPALVGVDVWNIDDPDDLARPAHTRLLDAGILIVEHLTNLEALPADGFRFFAVPLRIVRGASCPVRAFAELAS